MAFRLFRKPIYSQHMVGLTSRLRQMDVHAKNLFLWELPYEKIRSTVHQTRPNVCLMSLSFVSLSYVEDVIAAEGEVIALVVLRRGQGPPSEMELYVRQGWEAASDVSDRAYLSSMFSEILDCRGEEVVELFGQLRALSIGPLRCSLQDSVDRVEMIPNFSGFAPLRPESQPSD
jgi:hypothetical protein